MRDEASALVRLPPVLFAPFFAAGLAAAYYSCDAVRCVLAAAAVGTLALLALRRKRAAVCAAGALIGVCLMTGWVHFRAEPAKRYAGTCVETEYTIMQITDSVGDWQAFTALVRLDGRDVRARLTSAKMGTEGSRVSALVELSEPDERYEARCHAQGVMLEGKVCEIHTVDSSVTLHTALAALRSLLKGKLERALDGEECALAKALLVGDTTALSLPQREFLRISGISHYSAVSGTHFAVFAALLLLLLPEKSRLLRAGLALSAVPPALLLFGGQISVVRSALMLALCYIGELFGRKTVLLNSLCVAMTVICAANPAAVLDAGLQMSVMGVFGAGFVGARLAEPLERSLPEGMQRLRPVVKPLAASVGAVVCTSPLSIAYFGGISAAGAFTTIIAAPLFVCAMGAGALYFITGLPLLAQVLGRLMEMFSGIAEFFGKMRTLWFAMDYRGAVLPALLCAGIAAWAAFCPEHIPRCKAASCAALAAFSMFMCLITRESRSRAEFVSDGTSGAAIICAGDEAAVLISGGGSEQLVRLITERLDRSGIHRMAFAAGEELNARGVTALEELSQLITVERVYIPQEISAQGFAQGVERTYARVEALAAGGVTIAADRAGGMASGDIVLYYGKRSAPENNAQLALYASAGQALPENGVCIYGEVYTARLENAGDIIIYER